MECKEVYCYVVKEILMFLFLKFIYYDHNSIWQITYKTKNEIIIIKLYNLLSKKGSFDDQVKGNVNFLDSNFNKHASNKQTM